MSPFVPILGLVPQGQLTAARSGSCTTWEAVGSKGRSSGSKVSPFSPEFGRLLRSMDWKRKLSFCRNSFLDKHMGSVGLAFRVFFRTMFSANVAQRIRSVLDGEPLPKITAGEESKQPGPEPKSRQPAPEPPPKRSEAIALLAALQREARLVDLVQQPLAQFTDEQIGAAARGVLGDSAAVLARFFDLKTVLSENEGDPVSVPAGYDPGRYKLIGNVSGNPPYSGTLTHAGWEATTVNLPTWTGKKTSANIIAPAEIEITS